MHITWSMFVLLVFGPLDQFPGLGTDQSREGLEASWVLVAIQQWPILQWVNATHWADGIFRGYKK